MTEVRNPHIANLIEANCDAGRYYLATELIAGTSLAERLNERAG